MDLRENAPGEGARASCRVRHARTCIIGVEPTKPATKPTAGGPCCKHDLWIEGGMSDQWMYTCSCMLAKQFTVSSRTPVLQHMGMYG